MSNACHKFVFMGVDVMFPFESPYEAQRSMMASAMKAFMSRRNALLESPTGTGKSLALLAASLAYQEQTGVDDRVRVWFSSRTHTQLRQLIHELKNLPYQPRMTILGARSRFCVNEEARKSGNIEHFCRMNKHNCCYMESGNVVPDELFRMKFTDDELIEFCKERMLCPFFISREMMKVAELVFCPYNYIIDPKIRAQMKLRLDGSIVIIDEAHNIEDTCRQSGGFRMSFRELEYVKEELVKAMSVSAEPGGWLERIRPSLEKVNEVFDLVTEWFNTRRRYWDGEGSEIPEKDELTTLGGWKVNSRYWVVLDAAFAELTKSDKGTGCKLPERLVQNLAEFQTTMQLMFKDNGARLHDFRIVYKRADNRKDDQLSILCMNPGVVFAPIAQLAHSVVLTSGTLSPLDSFASELGVPFDVQLSADHVITKGQVMACVVRATDDGAIFSSSYSHLSKDDNKIRTVFALGDLVEKLVKVIPGGIVFFVPSQDFLKVLVTRWKSTRYFNSISAVKPIFIEERSTSKQVILSYKKAVENGRGGLLIGWYRGSVSEGIDFSDNQARAVIAFGVPYPNFTDIDIRLKKTYNEQHSKAFVNNRLLTADEWYDAQTFRALSQAIGRCIRHKKDYGAIVLIDDKYANLIGKLPAWVRPSATITPNTESLIERLRDFYSRMNQQFPDSSTAKLDLDSVSHLVCSDCGSPILDLYRFDPRNIEMMSKPGFLELIGSEEPVVCAIIQKNVRRQVFATIEPTNHWSDADSICYKSIVCSGCGLTAGAYAYAVSSSDAKYFDSFALVGDRLVLTQGSGELRKEVLLSELADITSAV